ncbi:MAG: hypothetical protein JXA35_00330, partial [Deltaproteobacteria bacterium]|nr:hypothetical protein [Deltaproteobacteria bacterium]
PERISYGNFEEGDVYYRLNDGDKRDRIVCSAGLSTASAIFRLEPGHETTLKSSVPLDRELKKNFSKIEPASRGWQEVLTPIARLKTPDTLINRLYDAAAGTLILLSAKDVYPGPYNYRRFWFRDACLMINAMLSLGLVERSRRLIDSFPDRQSITGFFQSQEGEWDSNGQVLWLMWRYLELTGESPPETWLSAALKAAGWLERKIIKNAKGTRHQGLLPPGFSAEHFGPNDYYYWDDMWALAGIKAVTKMFESAGMRDAHEKTSLLAEKIENSLWISLVQATRNTPGKAFPAAPYRRMDAGAIGSMVADYPLCLLPANNARIMATCEWLMANCFYEDGFFQDMVHSGVNCYLTLTLAQTLLRAGDSRYRKLIRYIAGLASSTGHWPEAVHPFSGGGCMGDGQHGWAAAEWVMMMRNLFMREEKNRLIIGSGIFPEWLEEKGEFYFGPAPVPWGDLKVIIENKDGGIFVTLSGVLKKKPDIIEVAIPGTEKRIIEETDRRYRIKK